MSDNNEAAFHYRKLQSENMLRYDREVRQPRLNCLKFDEWARGSPRLSHIVDWWADAVPEAVARDQAVWEIARSMQRTDFTDEELAGITGLNIKQAVLLSRIRKGAALVAAYPAPVDTYLKSPFVTVVYGRIVHTPTRD